LSESIRPFRIGVLGYLVSEGKTILLHKKQDGHYMDGYYVAPGGKRLPNEDPYDAVIREVREETGVTPINPVLRGILCFPDLGDSPFGGEWLCFVFTFSDYNGAIVETCPEGTIVIADINSLEFLPMWPGDRLFTPHVFSGNFFRATLVYRGNQLTNSCVQTF
jgi:8-oxo-dGTP diphosphatase